MGTHLNLFQGAVVCIVAVVSALGNGAGDAFISVTAHGSFLLLSVSKLGCTDRRKTYWEIIPYRPPTAMVRRKKGTAV